MQTSENKIREMLMAHGMFDSQVDAVMPAVKAAVDSMAGEIKYDFAWNGKADAYPEELYWLIFNQIKPVVLDWIDKNKPMAWFRPMFTSDPKAELARLKREGPKA